MPSPLTSSDLLLAFVENHPVLTDEQKQTYAEELEEGVVSPALIDALPALLEQELVSLHSTLEETTTSIADYEEKLKQEETLVGPEEEKILNEYKSAVDAAMVSFQNDAQKIQRDLFGSLEEGTRSKEQQEMDDIRKNLRA